MRICRPDPASHHPWPMLALAVAGTLLTTLVAWLVLAQFPNSADEYAYLFQAETLLEGRLWNETHPLQESFSFIHIAETEGRWVGRFPPGWPLTLAAAKRIGIPFWLVNPILSGLVLFAFFKLAETLHNRRVATVATAGLLCSSFFLFNGGSYFSHTWALLTVLLFYYHAIRFMEAGRWQHALASGAWIGLAFIARYYTAVLVSIPLLAYALYAAPRRVIPGTCWIVAGSAPFLALLFYYNYRITGDPLLLVTTWADTSERLGFGGEHELSRALRYALRHLRDLLAWASPAFLLIALLFPWAQRKGIRPVNGPLAAMELSVFLITVLGYLLYHSFGGNQYGPRFYFEAFPFLVLAVTALLFEAEPDDGDRHRRSLHYLYAGGVLFAALALPLHLAYEQRAVHERMDLFRAMDRAELEQALVFVSSPTGVLRKMHPGDLIRNGTSLSGDIILARDLGDATNAQLRDYFPQLRFYRYRRDEGDAEGRIEPYPP